MLNYDVLKIGANQEAMFGVVNGQSRIMGVTCKELLEDAFENKYIFTSAMFQISMTG